MSVAFGLLDFAVEGMSTAEELMEASVESLVLLESGLATRDADDRTALHLAASGGDSERLSVLLEKGAPIEVIDSFGKTALHWAAEARDSECLRILIEKGAQIEAKANNLMTALHLAAAFGNAAYLRYLLEKGAQIEAKDADGYTALHYAAQSSCIECVRILLLAHAHLVMRGMSFKFIAHPSEDTVQLSRRRLKVALLGLRYAGSANDGPKIENTAGDLIVSHEYMRPWFLLSHSGLKEDVFTVFLSFLAKGKKVDYALFRLAQEELCDFLVIKLKAMLRKINAELPNAPLPIAKVVRFLPETKQVEICKLCDSDLVEENFGDLIRTGIKELFNELLKVAHSKGSSASSSQSTSAIIEQTGTTSR